MLNKGKRSLRSPTNANLPNRRTTILPFPKGEGRGEGKGDEVQPESYRSQESRLGIQIHCSLSAPSLSWGRGPRVRAELRVSLVPCGESRDEVDLRTSDLHKRRTTILP